MPSEGKIREDMDYSSTSYVAIINLQLPLVHVLNGLDVKNSSIRFNMGALSVYDAQSLHLYMTSIA